MPEQATNAQQTALHSAPNGSPVGSSAVGSPASASPAPSGSPAGNPQARPCPKDCRKCSWMQQVCCSSMMSFQMFGVMNAMMQKLDAQSLKIAELSGRIAAIEAAEAELSAPSPIQGELFPAKE